MSIDLRSIPYTDCPKSRFTRVAEEHFIYNQPTAECGKGELEKFFKLLPTVTDKKNASENYYISVKHYLHKAMFRTSRILARQNGSFKCYYRLAVTLI